MSDNNQYFGGGFVGINYIKVIFIICAYGAKIRIEYDNDRDIVYYGSLLAIDPATKTDQDNNLAAIRDCSN